MNKIFTALFVSLLSLSLQARTVVAIDAGHGGKDPGAIGKNLGLKEKDVTLSISRELKALLDADPNFKAVMTRSGDYFIQLPNRTEIARKHRANYLISIHADSSPSSNNLRGASVWVLSNRRATDEMGVWLEDHEKQSELLGGAGRVLSNNNERYLNQTVLDLQFSHSQRSGFELGKQILSRMAKMTTLAKSSPQHASLSVLRSPDITSVLVETGFLSNATEEQLLSSSSYRKQIARAIYQGLVAYRAKNGGSSAGTVFKESKAEDDDREEKKAADKKEAVKNEQKVAEKKRDETKAEEKKSSSKKEREKKEADQKASGKNSEKSREKTNDKTSDKSTDNASDKPKTAKEKAKEQGESSKENDGKKKPNIDPNASYHIVEADQTLYSIARWYNTTPEKLIALNGIKNNKITVGKKLKVK